jgi:hypothetical protein
VNCAFKELRRLVADFTPLRLEFESMSGHVRFVVDKVALGQIFSEDFGFPANLYSTSYSTITIISLLGLVQ